MMKRELRTAALACAVALGGATQQALAQEEEVHAEEHHFDNAFALFLGASTHLRTDHGNETGPTVGLEYARRVSSWLKIGLLGEVILNEQERNFILLLPFFAHVTKGLVLTAGPGIEHVEREEGAGTHGDAKWDPLGRIGVIYEFEVNNFAIGPQLNADISGGHWTLVYGVAFGIGF
jgi:hypothetical protein